MRWRVVVALLGVFVMAVLLTGCGGGQESKQSQGGGKSQSGKGGAGQTTKDGNGGKSKVKKARDVKTVKGIVGKVDSEKNRIVLKPENEKAMLFRFKPENLKVFQKGKKVKPDAIERGQRLEVSYSVVTAPKAKVDLNVARSVKVLKRVPAGGGKTGGQGGETTG